MSNRDPMQKSDWKERLCTVISIVGFAIILVGYVGYILRIQAFPSFYILASVLVLPLLVYRIKTLRDLRKGEIFSAVSRFAESLHLTSMRVLAVYSAISVGSAFWLLQQLSVGDFGLFLVAGPAAPIIILSALMVWLGLRGMVFVYNRILLLKRKELITTMSVALTTSGYFYFLFEPSWFALCLVQIAGVVSILAGIRYYSGDFIQRLYGTTRDLATSSVIVLIISSMATATVLPSPFHAGQSLGWVNDMRKVDELSFLAQTRAYDAYFDTMDIEMGLNKGLAGEVSLTRHLEKIRSSSGQALDLVRGAESVLHETWQAPQKDQIQLVSPSRVLLARKMRLAYLGNLTTFFRDYGEVLVSHEASSLENLKAQEQKVETLLLRLKEAQESFSPLPYKIISGPGESQIVTLDILRGMYSRAVYFVDNPPPLLSFEVRKPPKDLLPNTNFQVGICVKNNGDTLAKQIAMKQISSAWFGPGQMFEVPDLNPSESAMVIFNMTAKYPEGTASLEPWKYEPAVEASWEDSAGKKYGPRRIEMGFANVRPFVKTTVLTEETLVGYHIATWIMNVGFAEAVDVKLTVDVSTVMTVDVHSVSPAPMESASRRFCWNISTIDPNRRIGPFTFETKYPEGIGEVVAVNSVKVEYRDQAGNVYEKIALPVQVASRLPSYFVPTAMSLLFVVGFAVYRLFFRCERPRRIWARLRALSLGVRIADVLDFVKMVLLAMVVFPLHGILNLVWMIYKSPLHLLLIFVPFTLYTLSKPNGKPLISWDDIPMLIFVLFLLAALGTQEIIEEH